MKFTDIGLQAQIDEAYIVGDIEEAERLQEELDALALDHNPNQKTPSTYFLSPAEIKRREALLPQVPVLPDSPKEWDDAMSDGEVVIPYKKTGYEKLVDNMRLTGTLIPSEKRMDYEYEIPSIAGLIGAGGFSGVLDSGGLVPPKTAKDDNTLLVVGGIVGAVILILALIK